MNRDVHIGLILTGLLPVVAALVRGGAIGTGATLGLAMIALGVVGLVREARRRLPGARLVHRR